MTDTAEKDVRLLSFYIMKPAFAEVHFRLPSNRFCPESMSGLQNNKQIVPINFAFIFNFQIALN